MLELRYETCKVGIMVKISDVFNTISKFYSSDELLWFVSSVSRFHRIQGCSELEKSADFIVKELLDVKNYEVKLYRYSYSNSYGIHSDIIGWDVKDGFTQLLPQGKILSSFLEARTAVVAHSPGGDVEAEIVYIGDGLNLDRYRNIGDKIVLSYGSPYLVYKLGCKYGASGFIFFRRNLYEKAIPYVGLFLSKDELNECRAPATTISREDAMRIASRLEKGDKVRARIYVETSYRAEAYAPVVEISIGDGDEEVHSYAHLCHPGGTVNDNVSGVATFLELIKAIDRAIDKNELRIPRVKKLTFVFFPEYYGSLPYLMDKVNKGSTISFGVNLDMVGERQWITNSTLYLIKPPNLLSKPFYESLVLKTLLHSLSKYSTFSTVSKTTSYRFDIVPYDGGSDHDLYLQFGVPSVMLNQWPDNYYHSNMDSIDKFDPDIAKDIGVAVGTATYVIASERFKENTIKCIGDAYEDFVKSYTSLKHLEIEEPSIQLGVQDNEEYIYTAPKGVLTLRFIVRKLGLEKAVEFSKRTMEDNFLHHIIVRYIPLITMFKPCTLKELAKYINLDYNRTIHLDKIREALVVLEELGVIKRIKQIENLDHVVH